MATIRKRDDKYRAEIWKNGVRKSKTFKTKAEAYLWAAAEEKKIEAIAQGLQPDTVFSEVIIRYQKEVTMTKRGWKHELNRLNRFLRHPIADKYIADITRQDLEDWINERRKTVQDESIRRELSTIGNIFKYAFERWNYIQKSPMVGLEMPKKGKARTRRVWQDDIDKIISVSGCEDTLSTAQARTGLAMLFAIETAMRAGEICGLTWVNVDLEKRIAHLPMTKNGTSRNVPLSKKAAEILKRLKTEVESEHCFDLSSGVLDATFRKLKKMAMIEDLHFHDTRREALTRLAKKVDPMTLSKISGHKDMRILQEVYYAPDMGEVATLLD